MTKQELSIKLIKMIENAPKGEVSVQYHLFGIKYAEIIKELKINAEDIVEGAGYKKSLAAEIRKGIKLSRYVNIKD